MEFQVRCVSYEMVDLDPHKLMGIAEASRVLGLSIGGTRSLIKRDKLTEYIDPEAPEHRYRRFVLRSEVKEMAAERQRQAERWGKGEATG